ncbi:MAG: hypothetical protein R3E77_08155 [Steroidobacteraceae bacterium]
MRSLKPLAFVKISKAAPPPPEADNERVVELFNDRAALKKNYAALQQECNELRDRVKQQEGATRRFQEYLETLEGRLTRAETAYPALAFHHLRDLWRFGGEQLQQFSAELQQQQRNRKTKPGVSLPANSDLKARQRAEAALRAAEAVCADALLGLAEAERALAELDKPWHALKRKEAQARVGGRRDALRKAEQALEAARSDCEVSQATPRSAADLPDPGGELSVAAKRAVNLAVIAYAEVLCLKLSKSDLLSQARRAISRREVVDDYGDVASCERLMQMVDRARDALGNRNAMSVQVKSRTDRLRKLARYASQSDCIPLQDSIAVTAGDALGDDALGASASRLPNVLAEDTWGIFGALLR